MTRCIMLGKYSAESIREISRDRTEKTLNFIKQLGGKVISMYALLGGYDLLFIVDFPKLETAVKVSLGLSNLTGIAFTTLPSVTVEDFDKMVTNL